VLDWGSSGWIAYPGETPVSIIKKLHKTPAKSSKFRSILAKMSLSFGFQLGFEFDFFFVITVMTAATD